MNSDSCTVSLFPAGVWPGENDGRAQTKSGSAKRALMNMRGVSGWVIIFLSIGAIAVTLTEGQNAESDGVGAVPECRTMASSKKPSILMRFTQLNGFMNQGGLRSSITPGNTRPLKRRRMIRANVTQIGGSTVGLFRRLTGREFDFQGGGTGAISGARDQRAPKF